MEQTTSFRKLRWRTRLEEAKRKTKEYAEVALNFVCDHKEAILFISPFLIKGAKAFNEKSQRNKQDRRVWDPEMGIFWQLRRPMTQEEKRYFTERVKRGNNRGDILEALKLLK